METLHMYMHVIMMWGSTKYTLPWISYIVDIFPVTQKNCKVNQAIWDTLHKHMRKTDGNKQIAPHYRNKTIQSNLKLNYIINIYLTAWNWRSRNKS